MAVAYGVDLEAFNAQGFLVVENVLDPQLDLDPVVGEYEALLDELTQRWHQQLSQGNHVSARP